MKSWVKKALNGEPIRMPDDYYWAVENMAPGHKESNDPYDWVPYYRLYEYYLASHKGTTRILPLNEYVYAVRIAFPSGEPCTRRVEGKNKRGICGVSGPLAERTPHERETYTKWKQPRKRRTNAEIAADQAKLRC